MKFKSTLAMLIVLSILMAILFLGCSKEEKTQTNDNVPAQNVKENTQQEEDVQPKEKKEIEISIAFWNFEEFGNDEIGKKIAEDLKIRIVPKPLSWDNDVEQIKLWGASGELPDIFSTYPTTDLPRFYTWLDQGLTRPIPEELVNKYPTLKKIFENDRVLQAVKQIKGVYAYIPRPESFKDYYKASHHRIYYRKDWLANLGIEQPPKTLDEFYNMLKAFTYNDPDKNGKDDTYGLTTAGLNTYFFGIWGIDVDAWIEEDGKFIPAYLSKRVIEPLKYLRKLYKENIYDPEFATNGYKQAIQKFTTNTFGVLIRNGDLDWVNKTIIQNWAVANPDVEDPLSAVGILDPLQKDETTPPSWPMFLQTCGTEVNAKVDDEKLDRILELFEYLFDPEIRKMLLYGIENVDYKIVDGKIEKTIDPNTGEPVNIKAKYPSSMIQCLSDWYWDNHIEDPFVNIAEPIKKFEEEVRKKYNAVAMKDDYLPLRFISTPTRDIITINERDAFVQIIVGDQDVEVMFDEFVKDAMSKGMDRVIEEVNAKAKELGIIK